MQYHNEFILAAAGAGKTTEIVNRALALKDKRVLLTTYTRENTKNIIDCIEVVNGFVPPNITVRTWYSFLLTDCIRPYQNYLYEGKRIENIFFSNKISNLYVNKNNVPRYYFTESGSICSDKLSEFAFECNKAASNKVIKRLEQCYDYIFIDESQDLSGYDFEIIEMLLESSIHIVMVGDSRQKTYSTSVGNKNKKFSQDITSWFVKMEKSRKGKLSFMNISYRCNQLICDFADKLFPDLPKTMSQNNVCTGHDGIFFITSDQLLRYYEIFEPQVLVYDKKTKSLAKGLPTMTFGDSKGRTFSRVLIIANGPIRKFLETKDPANVSGSLSKFYVAITRAKYSVTFLTDNPVTLESVQKYKILEDRE